MLIDEALMEATVPDVERLMAKLLFFDDLESLLEPLPWANSFNGKNRNPINNKILIDIFIIKFTSNSRRNGFIGGST